MVGRPGATLLAVTAITCAGIWAVHKTQETEREVCVKGGMGGGGGERCGALLRAWRGVGAARPPASHPLPTAACKAQNLHKGVIRDEEMYRLKRQQFAAAAAAQQQQQQPEREAAAVR